MEYGPYVSVYNLRFPKKSKRILKNFPKKSQMRIPPTIHPKKYHNNFQEIPIEFPKNSKRIPKEFPQNYQTVFSKIPKNFWLTLTGWNPFWACLYSLLPWASQTAQTEEFMFQLYIKLWIWSAKENRGWKQNSFKHIYSPCNFEFTTLLCYG